MNYTIFRNNTKIATIAPEGEVTKKLFGEETVTMAFALVNYVRFQIGDRVSVYGETYYISEEPTVEKINSRMYKYSLIFNGVKYKLAETQCFFYDENNALTMSEFDIMGTARKMLEVVVANANRNGEGWKLGTIDETPSELVSFRDDNCLSAIVKISEHFKVDFWIDENKTINLTERNRASGYSFAYGKAKGLKGITRTPFSEASLVTRLYAKGSERNIPKGYRNGQKNLRMGVPFLEKNTAKFGVIEHIQKFEDIYPKRVGTVTKVYTDPLMFADETLDFDLNSYNEYGSTVLMAGVSAKVIFQTGDLAGYTLEVKEYGFNSVTKTFTLLRNKDEKTFEIPSENFRPKVGDKYILVDIMMPKTYVDEAEKELQKAAQDYLDKNSEQRFVYTVETDRLYMKSIRANIVLGDTVRFQDAQFNLDDDVKIISITKNLQDPYDLSFEIAERATISEIVRNYIEKEKADITIIKERKYNAEMARRSWLFAEEIKNNVFDNEGYFDTQKIKPLSIETGMLSVGSRAQQFSLPNIALTLSANQRRLRNTAGQLVHLTINENAPRTWNVPANETPDFSNNFNYIYLKADKNGSNAVFVVSESKILLESDAIFYHFLVGSISSAIDGVRRIKTNYGFTQVTPGEITTGRISSANGRNWIDLKQDEIEINAKIVFSNGQNAEEYIADFFAENFEEQEIFIEYSANGTSGWHLGFQPATDKFMRQKKGRGAWSAAIRLVGLDGANGVPGKNGEDGETYYLHIAYADDENGGGFSQNPANKSYIGTYTDTIKEDSNNPRLYKWAKIRGEPIASRTEPANKYTGMVWIDLSQSPPMEKVWNGTEWLVVNEVEIGGRNYQRYINEGYILSRGSLLSSSARSIGVYFNGNQEGTPYLFLPITELTAGNYTVSLYATVRTISGRNITFGLRTGGIADKTVFLPPNVKTKVELTGRVASDGSYRIVILNPNTSVTNILIEDVKIEKGNQATDWTPAPEDLEKELAEIKAKADKLDGLGTMAWQNSVEKAQLGTSIFQGGYLKTELINASAIVSNGGGVRAAELNNAINAIMIGGRNLFRNSERPRLNRYSGAVVNYSDYPVPEWNDANAVRHQVSGGSSPLKATIPIETPPTDELRSLSFLIKNLKNEPLTLYSNLGAKTSTIAPLTAEWVKWEGIVGNGRGNLQIQCRSDNADFALFRVKNEKGNKASDWSPAPEDVDAMFANLKQGIENMQTSLADVKNKTDNFTSIQGGLVSTNVVSVGSDQANQNAFISGVTDAGGMSVRFGAGANYANKNTAPFRILDNGKMIATDAEISGKINATGGKIGRFEISGSTLMANNLANSNDAWALGTSFAMLSPEMVLFRTIGGSTDHIKEASFGITQSVATGSDGAMGFIKNNISNTFHENTALKLQAKNGFTNTALDVVDGDIFLRNGKIRVGDKTGVTGRFNYYKNQYAAGTIEINNGIITRVT